MEFRQLRYFLAVAEHLHFTEAAEKLGMAQPPLSQQIIKLEREVGVKLFIRHARRVELTEAGRIFQDRAKRVLLESKDALELTKKAARGQIGQLVIGFAGSTVFHPHVATLLRGYRKSFPGVLIKTEESNSTALVDKVQAGQIDCAVIRLPLNCRGLKTVSLAQEAMIAVLPKEHRLATQASIDLRELAADPFVLFPRSIGPELHDSIISACRAAGFAPQVDIESPQLSSTVNMVAAGFGVTVIPASLRTIYAEGIGYHDVKNKHLTTTIALVHQPRDKSAPVRNLMTLARELFRKHAAH